MDEESINAPARPGQCAAGWILPLAAPPIARVITTRAWFLPTLFAVCGSLMATAFVVLRGYTGAAVPLLLMFVLLAGLNSSLAFARTRTRAPAAASVGPRLQQAKAW
ncbi:hypothetical protein PV379_05780 [Streptomyces caniscabiei]|uniref:hypothetical protein n=1 Tax=Streptomyces caniscabiei TaxID=2746961 RepID=UPI0029A7AE4A|nr:hypothetical protein [Streptomyces caniscabiei]MDX2606208.1 hypothetical protein [Streptomyces caniscabiei]MDX2741492.1 hypothetical protein [Streptomyces caniscabiei]MDX2776838.1 hypothetical protein [Streptomyces caniscabiei]